jgi:hypothetical protein
MIANVKAELLQRERFDFDDGAILEMVIWRVPEPVEGCQHPYKYRLFYGRAGKRWVSYDAMTMNARRAIIGTWESARRPM